MVAMLPVQNIDKAVELLQINHSLSVTIHSYQLKDLKDSGKYSNRKKIELPDDEEETVNNVILLELEAEALALELELLAA
jgi:hypothetical protein